LIRQTPYCILIKFGDINIINYIIDLDVSTLYILGENTNSTPYDESEYPVYEQMYSELEKDFFRREQERIRSNFTGFKEKLKKDTKELVEKVEIELHNCNEYEKLINKTTKKANDTQMLLVNEEKKTSEEMRKLNHNMLFTNNNDKRNEIKER